MIKLSREQIVCSNKGKDKLMICNSCQITGNRICLHLTPGELLMPADSIKFTTQGDYACSWCGYLIPTKRDVLQEWCSADVSGMFCSESHAIAATNDVNYRAKWSFKVAN